MLGGVFKRFWMPLLLVAVVALGAYAVVRIRESAVQPPPSAGADANSGITDPFNPPKHITYEVTGTGGSVDVDYLDENGQPHRVDAAALPWSFTIVTTLPSMSANIVAQGDAGVEGCVAESSSTARSATSAAPTNTSRSSTAW